MICWWLAVAVLPPVLLHLWRRRHHRSWQWWMLWLPIIIASFFIAWQWPGLLTGRKILAQLILPPGCLWTGCALLTWFFAEQKQWRRAGVAVAAFCLLTLAGSRPLGSALLGHLSQQVHDQRPALANGSLSPLPAAVVLGGGTMLDAYGKPALGDSGDRLRLTAAGYHAGWYPKIIVTGSKIAGLTHDSDPQGTARQLLVDMGVPQDAVLPINAQTRTTSEELNAIQQWLENHPKQNIALITSSWHLPRAMNLAARRGIADRLVPLAAEPIEPVELSPEKLIPHGRGFITIHRALWEWAGLLIR